MVDIPSFYRSSRDQSLAARRQMRTNVQYCGRPRWTAHNEGTTRFVREPVDDEQFRNRVVGGEAIQQTLAGVVVLAGPTRIGEYLGFPVFEREPQNVAFASGQTSQLCKACAFELKQILVFFLIVGPAMDLTRPFSLLGKRRRSQQRCTEVDGQDAHGYLCSHPVEAIVHNFARSQCLAKPPAAL